MALEVRTAKEQIARQLRDASKVSSPSDLQSYVGSPVPVLGVTVPTMRAIVGGFAKANKRLTAVELNALGAALWSDLVFEEKSLAILLLGRYEKILDGDSWRLADGWVDAATGWALSDALASGPIAGMVYAKPSRFQNLLRWTRAKNIWRRRASTYALHRFVRAGELDKPFQVLEKLLYDEEFWCNERWGPGCANAGRKIAERRKPFCGTTQRSATGDDHGGHRTSAEAIPRRVATKSESRNPGGKTPVSPQIVIGIRAERPLNSEIFNGP